MDDEEACAERGAALLQLVRSEREIGAGRDDLHALLECYGVPFIVATDDAARALTAAEDVMGCAR
jgi:hypothetical protein